MPALRIGVGGGTIGDQELLDIYLNKMGRLSSLQLTERDHDLLQLTAQAIEFAHHQELGSSGQPEHRLQNRVGMMDEDDQVLTAGRILPLEPVADCAFVRSR